MFLFKHDSLCLGVETEYKIIHNWEVTKLNRNKNTSTFRTLTLENIERSCKEAERIMIRGVICVCLFIVMLDMSLQKFITVDRGVLKIELRQ